MMTEYDQLQRLDISDSLIDSLRFPGLFEEETSWGSGPGVDLQGIMDTRMGPPAVPMHPSSDNIRDISTLDSKSSVSLFDPQLQNSIPDSGDSRNQSILPPWSPYQSLSPKNTGIPFPAYAEKASYSNQDVWSPLHLTGLPANPSFMGPRNNYKQDVNIAHRALSCYQYGTSTDPGIQFRDFPPSDSGYGTKSCTTRSVISSRPIDTSSTPRQVKTPQQSGQTIDRAAPEDHGQHHESLPRVKHLREPLPRTFPEEIRCGYPDCEWKGKCPSDKRKHEARHRKMYKCDEPGCSRKDGFGTVNDLERHKKCIHNKEPGRGPKILYMCFAPNCPRRNKQWPRLDNFRQHLARMHPEEDSLHLLKKSEEWYHHWKESLEASKWLVESAHLSDLSSNKPQRSFPLASLDEESKNNTNDTHRSSCTTIVAPGLTMKSQDLPDPSESLTLSPIKNMRPFDRQNERRPQSEIPQDASQQSSTEKQPVALPALKSLNLPLEKDSKELQSMPSNMNRGRHNDIVAEAALNVVDAMTRLMDSGQRRQSHQEELKAKAASAEKAAALQDRKKEMLQKILSAALEHLGSRSPDTAGTDGGISENPSAVSNAAAADDEKPYKCGLCHRRTRLSCELTFVHVVTQSNILLSDYSAYRKHMKRHDRPYGCTFPKCYKKFGSKADWKRHENSQHFHLQSWRCTLPDVNDRTLECARLFYRQETFAQHITTQHSIKDEEVKPLLLRNRLGRNGQSQFWCGFCRKILPLKQQGLEAWNERFNHIDIEHFKRGERIGSWVSPTGRLTKDQEKAAETEERTRNREATNEISENECNSSGGTSPEPDDVSEVSPPIHQLTTTTTGYKASGTGSSNKSEPSVTNNRVNDFPKALKTQVEQTPSRSHNYKKRKAAPLCDSNPSGSSAPKGSRQGIPANPIPPSKLKKVRASFDVERQEAAASLFYTHSSTGLPETDIRYCVCEMNEPYRAAPNLLYRTPWQP
ncbi:predicted protein [Paecilomyces variotii No. 5]|uniref:C2H2-type domain-containing protein n=1 Tax=Byssochlamys spectabilis (strain No. 5 / NBRC 109023) TaxID=1356009 RepID=V5FSL0_BYSSN|nr:predicted protein [Paecilomyces variotii No. 5]